MWVLKNICGEDYLEEVASGMDLGSLYKREAFDGKNVLTDLISSLHGNS